MNVISFYLIHQHKCMNENGVWCFVIVGTYKLGLCTDQNFNDGDVAASRRLHCGVAAWTSVSLFYP